MSIQLWAEKNYHWYLKQTITYPLDNKILYITWSPNTDKDLIILSSKSSTIYTFRWEITYSNGKEESDKAAVAVIDGSKVLVTNFREVVVPPPMAQHTLQFEEPVNAISFAPTHSATNFDLSLNDFIAILQNNKIVYCKFIVDVG